jgi:hypothetical protein
MSRNGLIPKVVDGYASAHSPGNRVRVPYFLEPDLGPSEEELSSLIGLSSITPSIHRSELILNLTFFT